MRRAAKVDLTQASIIEAIRKAGWMVWAIKLPCDLLCFQPSTGRWQPIECKTPVNKAGKAALDKRQKAQIEFLYQTRTPIVTSPEAAVRALGAFPGIDIDTVHR